MFEKTPWGEKKWKINIKDLLDSLPEAQTLLLEKVPEVREVFDEEGPVMCFHWAEELIERLHKEAFEATLLESANPEDEDIEALKDRGVRDILQYLEAKRAPDEAANRWSIEGYEVTTVWGEPPYEGLITHFQLFS